MLIIEQINFHVCTSSLEKTNLKNTDITVKIIIVNNSRLLSFIALFIF
jgi:sulfur relay (sulfurtransferase) DsrF/TusC family protein